MLKKILIVKTSSLGDIIHTFPAISYLKAKEPNVQIDWVVEKPFMELVKAHPEIHHVYCVDTKRWRHAWLRPSHLREKYQFRQALRQHLYDAVFDFQGNTKSGLITLQARSSLKIGFSRSCVSEWPNCLFTHKRFNVPTQGNVREENLSLVKGFFNDTDLMPFCDQGITLNISDAQKKRVTELVASSRQFKAVMVCPGSQWQNKRVTTQALKDFLILLQPHLNCHFYLVWGSSDEKDVVQEIHTALNKVSSIVEKLPLPMLQNLMSHMNFVIAMDSLPLHLAGTTGVSTFSVFGASAANKYKPEGPQHIAMQGKCPYQKNFDRRCSLLRTCETGACIRNLSGEELFTFFRREFPQSA